MGFLAMKGFIWLMHGKGYICEMVRNLNVEVATNAA
jgi:hypothetical protein